MRSPCDRRRDPLRIRRGWRFAPSSSGRHDPGPPLAAETHPELLAELKAHRADAVAILEGWAGADHPCIRCGRESAPEDLFCRVECFECWRTERAARRQRAGAAP